MEVLSRNNTLTFHTDDMETAKYIARLFTAKHKFYEQNNLSAEPERSPVLIRRRSTWSASTMRRPPSYILQPVHTQYGEHLQDRRSSQDSIVQDGTYYSSETSLDRSSMEYNFHNGLARKGSVYSAPSTSSLNHLQTVAQASPVSSNLSIPGSSDVMRLDYIPRHRHSAIIAPSYRPTPDYESAVRQKRLAEAAGCHSQSLRSLNISSSFAYRQQGALVYSQPEMRERSSRLPGPWGPQMRYSMPATTAPSTHFSSSPATEPTGTIAHTVSTPELADGEQPGAGGYSAAHMLKNHLSRPPPPYPGFRPVASTPDLAGHPRGRPGSSSPELGARRVRQSVRSFQPESLVVRRSFRETGEPLTMATLSQQSSLEAMSNMVQDMEAITLRSLSASIVRRNTLREEAPPSSPRAPPSPEHARAPSDATVLIHDSESEKEDEEDLHHQTPALTQCSISAQLQAALARIPNRPPPAYPGPGRAPRSGAEEVVWTNARRSSAPKQDGSRGCAEQSQTSESAIGPSVSEPDLTCVKERVKTNVVRERPSSEMFFVHDSFVEREIMQRTMEKQKMEGDSLARPLWTAGQNSPYMTTPPIPERQHPLWTNGFNSSSVWALQCQLLERKLEEEDRVAIEFVQIPWKAGDRMPAAVATLPGNAERNRLPDVVPYEENRVMLMPTKENHTGYINASHIKVLNTGEEWHYIATQGPLPNTLQDFWQMVWEQGVNVIAMVTAEEALFSLVLQEGGRSQTHCYWPQPGSKQDPAVHGRFQVTTKFRTDSGCYANTALTVKNLLSGQERTVWHLQYTDWGRDGCPRDPQDFLCYLEEVRSVRRDTSRLLDTSRSPNPPVVVHCSTGVGLTGVLILTELLISCLEHSRSMDIPVMLARLRQQRMLMVQTFTQYKFVYHVLIHFLKNSRLI
ncbi:tyrosine-protein phosphatase non-receptor type 14-like isoform X1 [Arapaima gigas]